MEDNSLFELVSSMVRSRAFVLIVGIPIGLMAIIGIIADIIDIKNRKR